MQAEALLASLRAGGLTVTLFPTPGGIRIVPRGRLTLMNLALIQEHKAELLALLQAEADPLHQQAELHLEAEADDLQQQAEEPPIGAQAPAADGPPPTWAADLAEHAAVLAAFGGGIGIAAALKTLEATRDGERGAHVNALRAAVNICVDAILGGVPMLTVVERFKRGVAS
jgi:hypothetical protein